MDKENKFYLLFKDKWTINTIKPIPITIFDQLCWFWRMLGFYYKYNLKVLDNPVQDGDKWRYPLEYKNKELWWIVWKIRRF